jgi:hypothetical protein
VSIVNPNSLHIAECLLALTMFASFHNALSLTHSFPVSHSQSLCFSRSALYITLMVVAVLSYFISPTSSLYIDQVTATKGCQTDPVWDAEQAYVAHENGITAHQQNKASPMAVKIQMCK